MGNCNCSTPSQGGDLVVSSRALPIGMSSVRSVKRMGWKPDVPDFRDRVLALPSHKRENLPPKVDLRPAEHFEVYDQGHLGSCTANAISGAFHFAMVKEGLQKENDFRPSRLFIYYNEREMEGNVGTDSGAQIRDGIKSVNKLGVCSEKMWPYVEDTFTKKPSEECYSAALQDTAVEYARVPVSLEDMKGCLADGTPYVFGFMVFSSFMSPEVAKTGMMPMPSVYENLCGGHAVMAVGYDDEMQCFIVRNSWGPDWGAKGYFYMPYDVMSNPLMVQDPWAINFVQGKQLPTKPMTKLAEPSRVLGWKADKPDDRDLVLNLPDQKKESLPPKVDLRPKENFEVYDQGHLGSCTANAIGGAFHFAMVQEGLKQDWRPARLFIYYNERDMEGSVGTDSGAQIRDGIKSVATLGVCSEKLWPYDESTFTNKPSADCYQAALEDRAIEYARVPQSEQDMKAILAEGFPFVFGFMVFSSFMTSEVASTGEMPWPSEFDKLCGGHAVMAVGYDDEKRVFIVRNSWGEGLACWTGELSEEVCCHPSLGPGGEEACWDDVFTYERCCPPVPDKYPVWGPRRTPLVGIGIFGTWRPASECWNALLGSDLTPERCCNISLGPAGDGRCWDTFHSFEQCCLGRTDGPPLRKAPWERPPRWNKRGELSPAPPAPQTLPECWSGTFTWGFCCTRVNSGCFDEKVHTYDRCCRGLDEHPAEWKIILRRSNPASCLLALNGYDVSALWRPEHCARGRLYDVARARGFSVEKYGSNHLPWWLRPSEGPLQDLAQYWPNFPKDVTQMGSICVPFFCDIEDVGGWLAPRILPWWKYHPLQQVVGINATHVMVPPPLAQKLRYKEFDHGWMVRRPPWADEGAGPADFEYVLHEVRGRWSLDLVQTGALCLAAGVLAVAGVLAAHGSRMWVVDILAPQHNLRRLGMQRGPVIWDVMRLVLTALVAWIHIIGHGPWGPTSPDTFFYNVTETPEGLKHINRGFAILMVDIMLSQWSQAKGHRHFRLVPGVFIHALRRLLAIAPVVGFWTYVYIRLMHDEIPINNLLRSGPLQIWYWKHRRHCQHPAHLWPSLFLVHDVLFAEASCCHNTDVFEGLWQTSVAMFALAALTRSRRLLCLGSLSIWILLAAWHYEKDIMLGSMYRGTGHRFQDLVPAALLAAFWRLLLPEARGKARLRFWLGAAIVGLSMLQAWLFSSAVVPVEWHFLLEGFPGPQKTMEDRAISLFWFLSKEALLPLGLVMMMNPQTNAANSLQGEGQSANSSSTTGWSYLAAAAKLCNGMNAVNLLLTHYVSGYMLMQPLESSVYLLVALSCTTFATSLMISLATYLVIEAPIQQLVAKVGSVISDRAERKSN